MSADRQAFDNPQAKNAVAPEAKAAAALLGAVAAMHASSLLAILARNCPMAIGNTPEWLSALIAATDFPCIWIAGYWLLVIGLEDKAITRIR